MLRKKTALILACLGILSAAWAVKKAMAPPLKAPIVAKPAQKPHLSSIAASGIIEAVGENVAVGSPADGLVQEVFVNVWQLVKKGAHISNYNRGVFGMRREQKFACFDVFLKDNTVNGRAHLQTFDHYLNFFSFHAR